MELLTQHEHLLQPGKSIVVEGTDGTGKSTIADMTAWQLRQNGIQVVRIDEPAGAVDEHGRSLVPIADELRQYIKDGTLLRSPEANVTLFTAARFLTWATVTQPLLNKGVWRVQARDYTSTMAYQGGAEGFGIERIEELTRSVMGEEYMNPDFRVILDYSDDQEELRQSRISSRGPLEVPDTFEQRNADFQQAIRDSYRTIAKQKSIEIIPVVGSREDMANRVWDRMIGQLGLSLVRYSWDLYPSATTQ